MKNRFSARFKYLALLLGCIIITSCKPNSSQKTPTPAAAIKDSVNTLMLNIQRDITTKGPAKWLDYFDTDSNFFMASDGELAFRDYPSAKAFIRDTLVKSIRQINLKYANIRIDVLSETDAAVGASFHEELLTASNADVPVDGYFTGTAHFNGKVWKLRNLHWSIKKPTAY